MVGETITAQDIIDRDLAVYTDYRAVNLILRFVKEMEGQKLRDALHSILDRKEKQHEEDRRMSRSFFKDEFQ